MIHESPKTAAQFALQYDRHGDSYYDNATVEGVKKVFQKIQEEVLTKKFSIYFVRYEVIS